MKIFALGDPHYGRDMSRFGDAWVDHEARIRERWSAAVRQSDLVLLPGDFSWATTTKTIEKHLAEVDALPGRVIVSPGNHDRWWKKTERLRYDEVRFLNDAHMPLGDEWTLAATMGHDCPESHWWAEEMRADFEAAVDRLESTLENATAERPGTRILLMIHYPPRWAPDRPTAFDAVIARFPVDLVVYGHIHGDDLRVAHNGMMDVGERRVRYENVSCDRVLCAPMEVLELPVGVNPF